MNIVVFSPDIPYPPNRGGRADIWRRIKAFVELGHSVMLVNLYEPNGPLRPRDDDLRAVDDVVARRFSFPIRRGLIRTVCQLANSWRLPWHAATRVPDRNEQEVLRKMLDDFQPTHLWLDGPWFGFLAMKLALDRKLPLLYRSHNIEHKYLPRQAASAMRLRDRIAWRLASVGLERWELSVLSSANAAYDISMDDLRFWSTRGLKNIRWLPPLPEMCFRTHPSSVIESDVAFIGNLGTPNNVRGIEWLVESILPRVLEQFPQTRVLIVGSNPTNHVRMLCARNESIQLIENVADTLPYLFGAKVLVNPVRTGSGVQVKMLDMLMTDAPIVTTRQGTRGLPIDVIALFNISDDESKFSDYVCREMVASSVDLEARSAGRGFFTVAGLEKIVFDPERASI